MTPLDVVFVVGAFALILVGAELFTGGIEWLGIKLDLSHGATGSVLAAIGTATPETLIPIVAILFTRSAAADEIGVGAILGAPFMLGTLVMFLIGLTAYVLRRRRRRTTLRIDAAHASRDLAFFVVLYALALTLALLPRDLRFLKGYVGWVFLPAYFVYLYLVLRTPKRTTKLDREEEKEEEEAFEDLSFAAYLRRLGAKVRTGSPPLWLILTQVVISFGAILVGARFFATFVDDLSTALGLDALLVALILAPLATELPEAANSLIWTREGKDVIALGNVAGAMVFQSTIPVSIGVLLTPWQLGPYGTIAAVFALLSGVVVYAQIRLRARQNSLPLSSLMIGGSLYVLFIVYVVWTVATGQTS
ncbi:MAG: sodium:calcium antiporter [Chloroflexota bacterium]|nr:sodium:calcium antiporter [Chloroflexota bacterium]MDE3192257.1 sodium:calcium antiporter [Chloroflexota bacterium]